MRILVTGAKGFIGKNLVATLKADQRNHVMEIDRDSPPTELEQALLTAEFIFHLAGVNRPVKVEEFYEGNVDLTRSMIATLKKNKKQTPILFTSSIKVYEESHYGQTKLSAEKLLQDYADETLAKVYIYRLPNVFGKWARPNYNSVIATFCYQVSRDEPIWVKDSNLTLNLVYIDDVVHDFIEVMHSAYQKTTDLVINPVYSLTLGELVNLLKTFKESRQTGAIIPTDDLLIKKLYSTYLSYLPTDQLAYPLVMHTDHRGAFTEFIRTPDRGQFSINVCKPRIIKGNHWHHTKNEKFLVVSGHGVIRLRQVLNDELIEYRVHGEELRVIDIPVGYTHQIENTGETDLIVVIWCNECYDEQHPDTYPLEV